LISEEAAELMAETKRWKRIQIIGGMIALIGVLGIVGEFVFPDSMLQAFVYLGLQPTWAIGTLLLAGAIVYFTAKVVIWYKSP